MSKLSTLASFAAATAAATVILTGTAGAAGGTTVQSIHNSGCVPSFTLSATNAATVRMVGSDKSCSVPAIISVSSFDGNTFDAQTEVWRTPVTLVDGFQFGIPADVIDRALQPTCRLQMDVVLDHDGGGQTLTARWAHTADVGLGPIPRGGAVTQVLDRTCAPPTITTYQTTPLPTVPEVFTPASVPPATTVDAPPVTTTVPEIGLTTTTVARPTLPETGKGTGLLGMVGVSVVSLGGFFVAAGRAAKRARRG